MTRLRELLAARTYCDRCHRRVLGTRLEWVQLKPASWSSPAEWERWCATCAADCRRDAAYERAAARARLDGFAETNGRDWT